MAIRKLTIKGVQLLVENNGRIYNKDGEEYTQHLMGKYYCVAPYSPEIYQENVAKGGRLSGSMILSVARLVCMAFHPQEGMEHLQCDHIDSNPTNNISSNLRWVTRKQNNSRKHARAMKSKNHKITSHRSQYIKATNISTGEVRFFVNGPDFSDHVKCSKPLPYLALDGRACSAAGWRLEWISRDDPECEEFNAQVKERKERRAAERKAAMDAEREEKRAKKKALKEKMKAQKEKLRKQHKEMLRMLKEKYKRQMAESAKTTKEERERMKAQRAAEIEQEKKALWERHIVLQCDLEGNIVAEYRTASEAEASTGLKGIGVAIRKGKPWRGFVWRYKIPRAVETVEESEEIEVIQ